MKTNKSLLSWLKSQKAEAVKMQKVCSKNEAHLSASYQAGRTVALDGVLKILLKK